jgi:hypothetical protein
MVLTYDSCYKLLFSAPQLVRELITGFMPVDWLHSLDYDTLEKVPSNYVGDNLRQRTNDVVWRIQAGGEWVYLYMQLEFQRTIDTYMAVRVMDYLALLYQDLARRREVLPKRRLPPVLPVVLYTGIVPWDASTDMAAMVARAPQLPEKYHPRLAYLLIDMSQYQDSDLKAMNNRVAMAMRFEKANLEDLPPLILHLSEMLDGDTELHRIFSIWMRELLYRRSEGVLLLPELVNLMEVNMSLVQSLHNYRQAGVLEGKQEGKREGKQEGEAHVLQKVLAQRFGPLPPDIASRIAVASPVQLEAWVDRLGAAQCLDDVFEDPNGESRDV